MVCLTNSNNELCNLLKKTSIPQICSEHECYTNPYLCVGLKSAVWPQHASFKAYFPCTRAKPHLHKRHNKTLWLVILNLWLTAPCWPQGLVAQQPRHAHDWGLGSSCTNALFYLWFNEHRMTEKVHLLEPQPGRQGLACCYYMTGTSHSMKISKLHKKILDVLLVQTLMELKRWRSINTKEFK